MPGQIHRLGDQNDAGAQINGTKQTLVSVGGQPVATDGDPIEAHGIGEHASHDTSVDVQEEVVRSLQNSLWKLVLHQLRHQQSEKR